MKIRYLSFIVVALAAGVTAHAQLNPGEFHLDVSAVRARPVDNAWDAEFSEVTTSTAYTRKQFDVYYAVGNEWPVASIINQPLGGYWSWATHALVGAAMETPGAQVESIHTPWEDVLIRWYARYEPAGSEFPISPDQATILQGHMRECVHAGWTPQWGFGWAQTQYFDGLALGNPLVDNTAGFGSSGVAETYEIYPALVWSGPVAQDPNLGNEWILRATAYTLGHIFNTQTAKAYPGPSGYRTATNQSLVDSTLYKVTWIDYRQVDRGFLRGDIDGDGDVGPGDFGRLSASFGSVPGDFNWDEFADIDGDEEVGPGDSGILSAEFGKTTFDAQTNKTRDLSFW